MCGDAQSVRGGGYTVDRRPSSGFDFKAAIHVENSMTEQIKGRQDKPGAIPPAPAADHDKPKEKSEAAEVAGRHKNSGQKDHKGAR
jgi:hypothetical protein